MLPIRWIRLYSGMTLSLFVDPLPASPFQGEEGDCSICLPPPERGGVGVGVQTRMMDIPKTIQPEIIPI